MEIKNAKQSRRTYPAQEFQFDSAKVRNKLEVCKCYTKFNVSIWITVL